LPLVNLLAGGDCTAAILAASALALNDRSTQLGLFALFWFMGVFGFSLLPPNCLATVPLMPAAAILALLWSEELKVVKGKRQNFFLFQLSGWLNVVFCW